MQVVKPSSPAPKLVRRTKRFTELSQEFCSKLKVTEKEEENKRKSLKKSWWNQDEIKNTTSGDKEIQEGEDEFEEFSFASVNVENSPISAEEAFKDGKIRPVYPLFNQNLLFEKDDPKGKAKDLPSPIKKLFIQNEESEPMGPYCSWSSRTVEEASPKTCRKSNSTGFSKLRRFRDLVLRSNSDGKDAFVFLNNGDGSVKSKSSSLSSSSSTKEKTKKKMKPKSAHERLYMRNRAMREEEKRKSYIPYKHVGFFTNVHGLTRNVHPY